MQKKALKFVIAVLMLSFTVVACNNDKKEDDKKEPAADTTTVAPPPPPAPADTTQMDKDTADTRPVKPID